ncbi:hypothetical protein PoB_001416400 [Plakobranchus ocellatus]|uniref:Uncharacterized protein n=1 Tax=Plakobranchus ocellatus TaxID=259542 RepID=A0AAV3YX94_9GAST|nr:hypothetical protein PoB_001416400 [Plakobranchus ocellatus]
MVRRCEWRCQQDLSSTYGTMRCTQYPTQDPITTSPQQRDLRLSGPSSGQDAGSGTPDRYRMVLQISGWTR